jgi:hypothetical protein
MIDNVNNLITIKHIIALIHLCGKNCLDRGLTDHLIKQKLYVRCKNIINSTNTSIIDKKLLFKTVCKYDTFSIEQKTSLWRKELDD